MPVKITVEDHHIGVYASKKDESMIIRAPHPKKLLRERLVLPSLAAGIMNAKYVNATPLARIESEMARYGLPLSRRNMANWMIRLGEEYIAVLYKYLHKLMYGYHSIHELFFYHF